MGARAAGLFALLIVVSACAVGDGVAGRPGRLASTTIPTFVDPEMSTTTSTLPVDAETVINRPETTEPPVPKSRIVIHGVGDVNLDPSYIPALATNGYDHAWTGLDGLFATDDLTIVNLECAASDLGEREFKQFTFRCALDALDDMAAAGVEVANLGNNHSQDYGTQALVDSRRNLRAVGVEPVGAGKDLGQATKPAIFDVGGWRVAVVGFGGVVPEEKWLATTTRPGMASGDDIPTMVAAVEAADELADLVFVTIHWGTERDAEPRQEDIERAHAMIDAGADGIFGHHQHRLQGLDVYEGKPIAWGLGNFVWPRLSDVSATTAIAEFVVEADGTIEARLIPAFIETDGRPVITE